MTTTHAVETQRPVEAQRRAFALDALRGLAILMMVLAGMVPAQLPAWMHHAQVPPPELKFNPNIPGITWVDLVFPFFLFAMGAAIPLALTRRMERGDRMWRILLSIFQRFLLLGLFAFYVASVSPFHASGDPSKALWGLALAGFIALFAVLVRLPSKWPLWRVLAVRALGWIAAVAVVIAFQSEQNARLTVGSLRIPWIDAGNYDIIIRILANVVLGGSLIWLLTRKNPMLRAGFMAVIAALRFATIQGAHLPNGEWNWVMAAWEWSPQPWLSWVYHAGMMSLLLIALPGTFVGDLLLEWMKSPPRKRDATYGWAREQMVTLAVAAFALIPLCLWGLFTRHVAETFLASGALCIGVRFLSRYPKAATERLLSELASWGIFWLLLGLLFEPFEGGIKKDPATMSYYFVTAGLACFLMVTLTVLIDVFHRQRPVQLLIDNGQNPMMAYVGLAMLVQPVLFLTGINPAINKFIANRGDLPSLHFVHGVVATLLLAVAVSVFSRRKVFWRT